MLDNRSAEEAGRIIGGLKAEGVWDDILIEVSGGISGSGIGGIRGFWSGRNFRWRADAFLQSAGFAMQVGS